MELSTGTHRVPDELRKHYLSDGESGQYSTNLDRNRYGNDDQYLFTGESGWRLGAQRGVRVRMLLGCRRGAGGRRLSHMQAGMRGHALELFWTLPLPPSPTNHSGALRP